MGRKIWNQYADQPNEFREMQEDPVCTRVVHTVIQYPVRIYDDVIQYPFLALPHPLCRTGVA